MNKINIKYLAPMFVIVVAIGVGYVYSIKSENHPDKQSYLLSKFIEHKSSIIKYSKFYNVSPRLYVSVIYGELFNNFDIYDEFDETRARLGFDPSIGFSQIRISTAIWIENTYADSSFIIKSHTKKELIDKLLNDDTNIAYSVLYVSIINKKLRLSNKAINSNTIGSYYGKGVDFDKRIDDVNYTNRIGMVSEKLFNSTLLLNEFPK